MKKKIKPTLAQQLSERSIKSQFNKLVGIMRKEADKGGHTICAFALQPYTIQLLKNEGITVEKENYFEFEKYRLRWPDNTLTYDFVM